jgi:ABC-type antimicrobial peptide transport system permease subunit
MRRAVQAVLPESPAVALASLDEVLQPEIKPWRMAATMFSIFGVLALGLSAVGLFGLVSFSARQRSSEVAIRMALGARMPHVIWILTRSTMAAVGLGIEVPPI